MMQKRQILIVIVSVLLLASGVLLMQLLQSQKPDKKKKSIPPRIVQVQAEKVSYSNQFTSIQSNGRITATEQIDIVSEATGKILLGDIPLKKGASFQNGDVLFSIYKDEKELDIKAQKSIFLSNLANALVELKIDFPEQSEIFMDFFSKIDVETELPDFPEINDNKLKIFLSNKNIQTSYYQIKKNELALRRYIVKAPFDGSICEVTHEYGTYVNAGNTVARIIGTKGLEVEVAADNDYQRLIKVGDFAQIYDQQNHLITTGSVVRKSDFIDPSTQSTICYIKLDNHKDIKVGSYVKVRFSDKEIADVMAIPHEAVFDMNKVHTVENGILKTREIDIVLQKQHTIYFSGLDNGIHVVTEPLVSVKTNTKVLISGEEPQADRKHKKEGKRKG